MAASSSSSSRHLPHPHPDLQLAPMTAPPLRLPSATTHPSSHPSVIAQPSFLPSPTYNLPPLRLVSPPFPPGPPPLPLGPPHLFLQGKSQKRMRPPSSHTTRNGKAKALPDRMQDPSGDDFPAPKLHKKKVVYRPHSSGQLKGEPELLRRDVPHSSGMVQKPPKRSLKSERPATPPSDRGTPDSLPDSGPTDEYRALRRKYMMLEEENFALDNALHMEDEEVKALEVEKLALLDELVVLEGLVEPSELQSQRRP